MEVASESTGRRSTYEGTVDFIYLIEPYGVRLNLCPLRRFGRRKFANQNLTERYQLLENLKTTRLIAVVVLTFAMSLIIDIGTVIVLIYLQTKNYEAMALWKVSLTDSGC